MRFGRSDFGDLDFQLDPSLGDTFGVVRELLVGVECVGKVTNLLDMSTRGEDVLSYEKLEKMTGDVRGWGC